MSALGHEQTFAPQKTDVRFSSNSDRKSGFPQRVMSALHLKADVCGANRHIRFGPIADIRKLFDHIVGAGEYCRRNGEAQCLSGLEVDNQLVLGRCLHW